MAKNL